MLRTPLVFLVTLAGIASAATVDFTFKGAVAQVSFNGGSPMRVDLSVDLLANTDDLVRGGGRWGSDRYLHLKAFVTSRSLGLSNVEVTNPLEVHIGGPAADPDLRDSTVMFGAGNDILTGIFNLKAIEGWDRVSSIGPLFGSAVATDSVKLILKNGATLTINTFESAQPYGQASFQAHVIPGVTIANSQ